MGNTPKVGVGIIHVLREALRLIGNPYATETTLKFFIRWKAFTIIMAILQRDPETSSRTSLTLAAFKNTEGRNLKVVCVG